MSHESGQHEAQGEAMLSLDDVLGLMLERVEDGLDHPELWADIPTFVQFFPEMENVLAEFLPKAGVLGLPLSVLYAVTLAVRDPAEALRLLEPVAISNSLNTLVQGAFFHIQSLIEPDNARYDLSDRFCRVPFEVMDVLENSTHLCCASWVTQSAGNLNDHEWQDVWDSDMAQKLRASIHDGSYRYCNKTACPHIGRNALPTKTDMAKTSDFWRDVVTNERTAITEGPYRVNLAYDRTCNLSCPSCRVEKWAADGEIRARFDKLQEEKILPLLKTSKLVFITGSGDPFASKNFRNLMTRLTPEDYPELRFQIMTNGMLFTRREWERFPALHGRVASLRISLDAATGPTHELLRRGARWEVMLENLAFAAELRAAGLVSRLDFAFTVQSDNYREMGDAVDFAIAHGADHADFLRLTNWGTFTAQQYADRAVFMPSHPEHGAFLQVMRDPRLRDSRVTLSDLASFLPNDQDLAA